MTALEQLQQELGVPLDDLIRTVEQALGDAYKRSFNPEGYVSVHIDPQTAALEVTASRVGPDGQRVEDRLPSEGFARVAAQTAKQAVLRHIHSLERERALQEASEHRGELGTGIVDRIEKGTVYFDLGAHTEGVLPPEEQIPGDEYRPGKPMQLVLMEPRRSARSAQIQVSRANRLFVRRLLEAEVPEIARGVVTIRALAREPGLRTKVAVSSEEPGVDPVGACVGPKGIRHRALISELGREHIDFVPWSDDPAQLTAAAIGPATVTEVRLDRATNTALLEVPTSQLSLAIGKDGQNARLAAKLTGWRIDIKPAPDGVEDAQVPS